MNNLPEPLSDPMDEWWRGDEPAASEAEWGFDFASDDEAEYLRYADIMRELEEFAAAYDTALADSTDSAMSADENHSFALSPP